MMTMMMFPVLSHLNFWQTMYLHQNKNMGPLPKEFNSELQYDDSTKDDNATTTKQTKEGAIMEAAPTNAETASSSTEKCGSSCCRTLLSRCTLFYLSNEFLILVVASILLARAYPPLGAVYLYPDITATWIAVCLIFLMAGLGLQTQEFSKAIQQIRFNVFVQVFGFGVVSSTIYGVTRVLAATYVLSIDLANAMVVTSCLPMTMNMIFVLTKSSGGDEGLAIVNSAVSNLVGVFLSPLLILGYLGTTSGVDLGDIFYMLAARVMLPLAVGQVLQKCAPSVHHFYTSHRPAMKRLQEFFCRTFSTDSPTDTSIGDIFLMIGFVFLCLAGLMAASWYTTGIFWKNEPKLRVMALFGCTHKTIAIGLPLINAIYENHPAVGLYALPLLTWHPMQLLIGSLLAPRLAAYVARQEEKLLLLQEVTDALSVDDDDDDDNDVIMEQGEVSQQDCAITSKENSQTSDDSETMQESEIPLEETEIEESSNEHE